MTYIQVGELKMTREEAMADAKELINSYGSEPNAEGFDYRVDASQRYLRALLHGREDVDFEAEANLPMSIAYAITAWKNPDREAVTVSMFKSMTAAGSGDEIYRKRCAVYADLLSYFVKEEPDGISYKVPDFVAKPSKGRARLINWAKEFVALREDLPR